MSVLILVPSGYSGLSYITFDVILKEFSHDVVVASSSNGTVKADDDSSVLTVSFSEAFAHLSDYVALVLISGSDFSSISIDPVFQSIVSSFNSRNLPVAVDQSVIDFLSSISNVHVYTLDSLESFVESFASLF